MTDRRQLSPETTANLQRLKQERDDTDAAFRHAAVAALTEGSIREVARTTGVALSTLQNWRNNLND